MCMCMHARACVCVCVCVCLKTIDEIGNLGLKIKPDKTNNTDDNDMFHFEIITYNLVENLRTECDGQCVVTDKCCSNKKLLTYVSSSGCTSHTFDVLPYMKRDYHTACVTKTKFEIINAWK